MTKKHVRILSLVMAVAMIFCMGVSASAANITESGGSSSAPLTVTTTSDGTGSGDITATPLMVTVPTVMPLYMGPDGEMTTAGTCRIVNDSYGPVKVTSVAVSAVTGWSLAEYGKDEAFAAMKINSNKVGFSVKIGSGSWHSTTGTETKSETIMTGPDAGCYLTGVNGSMNAVNVDYDAQISQTNYALEGTQVANVVFVVEWDEV